MPGKISGMVASWSSTQAPDLRRAANQPAMTVIPIAAVAETAATNSVFQSSPR